MISVTTMEGRISREPELKTFESGKQILEFSIANDRNYKNQQGEKVTDFVECRINSEATIKFLQSVGLDQLKGRLVMLTGRINFDKTKDQPSGKTLNYPKFQVNEISLMPSRQKSEADGASPAGDDDTGTDVPVVHGL